MGETYRADAQTWIRGIERVSGLTIDTLEVENTGSRFGRILKFLGFGLRIVGNNFTKSYDLVLAERATSYGFFSLFVRAKKRIVAQQGITDAWPETGFSGVYKRFLQAKVYQQVDLIHAWGQVMVPAMLSPGVNPEKILILPKGLDLARYTFQRTDKKNVFQAIVTRSLTSVYHHADILNAMAVLKKKGILIHLTIVGDGDRESSLRSQADTLGLTAQILFLGRIPNDSLPSHLQNASIYLSVPETEGVSASLFEAMASGCFPIVTDLEGTRAFIDNGENGFLIPVNSPDALAEAIEKFLANSEEYAQAVFRNRAFIEEKVDLEKNMSEIWGRYLKVFNS